MICRKRKSKCSKKLEVRPPARNRTEICWLPNCFRLVCGLKFRPTQQPRKRNISRSELPNRRRKMPCSEPCITVRWEGSSNSTRARIKTIIIRKHSNIPSCWRSIRCRNSIRSSRKVPTIIFSPTTFYTSSVWKSRIMPRSTVSMWRGATERRRATRHCSWSEIRKTNSRGSTRL